MTIDISTLILDVQVSLSDIPADYATDEQLYSSLKMAQRYVDSLKDVVVVEELESQAIISLASFYAYVNYTSLVERTRGEVNQASSIKLAALQRIAVSFLRRITTLPIKDDTTVDQVSVGKKMPVAVGLMKSFMSTDMYD
jgi:hypothetical protein